MPGSGRENVPGGGPPRLEGVVGGRIAVVAFVIILAGRRKGNVTGDTVISCWGAEGEWWSVGGAALAGIGVVGDHCE